MIRRATAADMTKLLGLLRRHHAEKAFTFQFSAPRLSMTMANAMAASDQLLLVGEQSLLLATSFDCPMGSGRLAVERVLRCEASGEFDPIVDAYEDWARTNGCVEASLSCTDRPAAFARLYGRRGYAWCESTHKKVL